MLMYHTQANDCHPLAPSSEEVDAWENIDGHEYPVHGGVSSHIWESTSCHIKQTNIHHQHLNRLAVDVVEVGCSIRERLDLDDGEDTADYQQDRHQDLDLAGHARQALDSKDDQELPRHHDELPVEYFFLEAQEEKAKPFGISLNCNHFLLLKIALGLYLLDLLIELKQPSRIIGVSQDLEG